VTSYHCSPPENLAIDLDQRCQMPVFSARFGQFSGFESCLAGIFYFWRVPNFWRISGRFDQFCTGLFLSDRSGGILAVFESLLTKKQRCSNSSLQFF
jgi:hypothetical protein